MSIDFSALVSQLGDDLQEIASDTGRDLARPAKELAEQTGDMAKLLFKARSSHRYEEMKAQSMVVMRIRAGIAAVDAASAFAVRVDQVLRTGLKTLIAALGGPLGGAAVIAAGQVK